MNFEITEDQWEAALEAAEEVDLDGWETGPDYDMEAEDHDDEAD